MRNSKGAKPSLQSPGSAALRAALDPKSPHPRLSDVLAEVKRPSLSQHAEAKSLPGPYAEAVYEKVLGIPRGSFFDAKTRARLDKLAAKVKVDEGGGNP